LLARKGRKGNVKSIFWEIELDRNDNAKVVEKKKGESNAGGKNWL